MAAILNAWRRIKNRTLSIYGYLREDILSKFHPDAIWNDGDLGFLKWSSQQDQEEEQDE